jgi:hypothetical protein
MMLDALRAAGRVAVISAVLASAVFGAAQVTGTADAAAQSPHAAQGSARPRARCMTERLYLQSPVVRIFRTRGYVKAYDNGGTIYQGCLRPDGKPLRVAVNLDNGEYPPEVVLEHLTVAGAYVAALSVVGEASQAECDKSTTANPHVCPVPNADVHVVDMRTRQAVDVAEPAGTVGPVLSRLGAAAWLVPQAGGGPALEAGALETKDGKLTLTPQQLDAGTIANVRFNGFTLTWTNGGSARSATLGHQIQESSCHTVDVATMRNSSQTVDRCERLNVGFEIGTQGQIFPVWELASKPAKKILKLVNQGYEDTDATGETTTQFFLLKAVGAGTTAVKFVETTASSRGVLETFELHIRVREILGGTTTTITTPTVTKTTGPAPTASRRVQSRMRPSPPRASQNGTAATGTVSARGRSRRSSHICRTSRPWLSPRPSWRFENCPACR